MTTLRHLWLRTRTAASVRCEQARHDERGSIITEYPALAAIVVTGALAIAAIIVAVATGHANAIPGAGG